MVGECGRQGRDRVVALTCAFAARSPGVCAYKGGESGPESNVRAKCGLMGEQHLRKLMPLMPPPSIMPVACAS